VKKKLLALLLVLVMIFSMAGTAFAEDVLLIAPAPSVPKVEEGSIVILHTNDIHTYIDGEIRYSDVAALKTYYESLGAIVILVDAGDAIQGTAYGSMDKGKTIIDLMNATGYDVATLGNHEFDYGMEGAMNAIEWAEFPYTSANFYHEVDGVAGETVLKPYEIVDLGFLKIAFVGITTPETFTKSTPAYFQDGNGNYIYGIAGGEDGSALYAAVQKALDAAAAEADIVIGLAHLGDDPASQPWTSEEVIANTTGFDIVIDGHSHSTVIGKEVTDKAGNIVTLSQTGEYLGGIGVLMPNEDHTTDAYLLDSEFIGNLELTPDAEVKAIEDAWIAEIDTQLGVVIGTIDDTLDNYDAEGKRLVRSQETNTGDFAADALYYLFDNMGLDVDVAIMNGGGVRNKAITGELSYKTMKEIHTFGNVACLQTITGQQLLDALEWGSRDVGSAECGGFLHVSGIKYTINTAIPSTVQKDEKGVWTGGPTGAYRVTDVKILQNGEYVDLDLTAKYNLAGYNYTLRDLGDGFAMFDGAVNVLDYVMEDYMVLANYVQSFPADGGAASYVVAKGDTLWGIASNLLGHGAKWSTIYEANKAIISNPSLIFIGQELTIPGASSLPKVTGYAEPQGRITIINESPVLSTLPAVEEGDTVVLYTNDTHTYIDGDIRFSHVAALKEYYEILGANVVLVDAGDAIQGTAYGSMDKGETIIKLMNAAGYDLATLGNHEFDYGMEGRIKVTDEWAEFPYVSANFYHEVDGAVGDSVLDPYLVLDLDGLKIAFVGVTTPESFTKSTPAYFQDENGNYIYGIAGGEDGSALYAAVQTAVDAAAEEADYVVVVGHLGDDLSSQPWTSEEVIANTTGIDVFIDGHSHSTVEKKEVADKNGDTVYLTQTGEYLGAIGVMIVDEESQFTLVTAEDLVGLTPDAAVKAIEDAWITEIDTQLGQVIGSTTVTLDNYDVNGNRLVRIQETNTGDFAADALYYLFDNMGLDVDFAIMNGGGIRNTAVTGELSYKTMKEIHTFGNVACLQTITGQQILDALEWGARQAPDVQVGGFLHVSGLKYTIDANIESTVQQDDKGVWIGAPTGEYRVKDVMVLNNETNEWEPLDLEAKYNLAGYNYTLRDLGDGFAMFDGAVNVLDYVMEDYMVLANYVQSFPVDEATGLPTIKDIYTDVNGEGRITIIAKEAEEQTKITVGGLTNNVWTTKYGNLYCDCPASKFAEMGYTWGDLVTVKFLNQELVLPVIPTYSYVDTGKAAIIMEKTETGAPTGYLSFAINMGNFTEAFGIATKQTDADGNWWWTANEGVTFPIEITFEMHEQGGYMAEYILRDLTRTNVREDYAGLTDEEFANFRAVATTGMGEGVLYRSSSPINPELGRNAYADAAIEAAGVKTIINLADNAEDAAGYEGFADTYYSAQNVIYLCLGVDFAAADFQSGLANGLRFMAANEGPYLVHCTEGKDRAGFVDALLECFMGATYEEVVADYMVTYYNYYGVEPGTDKYTAIANSNIIKSLQAAFGVTDLAAADLKAEATEYLAAIGLTEAEIAALAANLSNAPAEPEEPEQPEEPAAPNAAYVGDWTVHGFSLDGTQSTFTGVVGQVFTFTENQVIYTISGANAGTWNYVAEETDNQNGSVKFTLSGPSDDVWFFADQADGTLLIYDAGLMCYYHCSKAV